MKMASGFLCLLAFWVAYSCAKDEIDIQQVDEQFSFSALTMTDEVALSVSYDMMTFTIALPVDPGDSENITQAEQILGTPIVRGCKVKQMVKKDGTIDADIEMVKFEGMPEYPKNMVGKMDFPEGFKTQRIEVRDGVSTHFNSANEVIATNVQSDANIAYYQKVADELAENVRLSVEEFGYVLEGFKEAGFEIKDNALDPNFAEMTHTFPDGGSTTLFIDKELNQIDSRVNFDAAGEVETISDFLYKDEGNGEKSLVGHRFVTYYQSPFSDVKMSIRKVSKIENFNIQKNL